jgi:S-adenosylmethionine:tRNA ribosyltransferase-isomerase
MTASSFEDTLALYDYPLEQSDIAVAPAVPRESARLLVCDRATQSFTVDTFENLAKYLHPQTLIVLNNTRVIPARLTCFLPTGGKVEVLCTSFENTFTGIANRRLVEGVRLKIVEGVYIDVVEVQEVGYVFKMHILDAYEGGAANVHSDAGTHATLRRILETHGTVPLPPYLKHTTVVGDELRQKYQTTFALHDGSVAAPTASLHFSEKLLQKLTDAGHEIVYVTLHVSLGTFLPITEAQFNQKQLHAEQFEIPEETVQAVQRARRIGRAILPIGTTATRTLETAFAADGTLLQQSGTTTLCITEGYTFKIATQLVTNFHVPRSSLLMLVGSFMGRTLMLRAYAYAKSNGFKFLSFGDGMLIR